MVYTLFTTSFNYRTLTIEYERIEIMQIQVTKECNLFNCDKRHGNYCCHYCTEKCHNACLNDPSCCDQYMKPKKHKGWCTQIMPHGIIDTGKSTLAECMRKLADYEATKLQPQDVVAMLHKHGGGGLND